MRFDDDGEHGARIIVERHNQIGMQLCRVELSHRARFDASLAPLRHEVAAIRSAFAGSAVAYTEPVPGYLLAAAGLRNLAPGGFTRAIEDGTEPSPAALSAMTALATDRRIKVLLYNTQAVSPITTRIRTAARAAGIAIVGVSETMPAGETFQSWQLGQARALDRALHG